MRVCCVAIMLCLFAVGCAKQNRPHTRQTQVHIAADPPGVQLHKAIEKGDLQGVTALLEKNPDPSLVNWRDKSGNYSPLDKAAYYGHVDIAKLLISRGAAVDSEDKNGNTSLWVAAMKGNTAVAALLIAHGARVNGGDSALTPLHAAVLNGHGKVAQLLIAKGANVNRANDLGSSPLHTAVTYNEHSIAALLIAKGADVNARDGDGFAPLHIAARGGFTEIAQMLLENGAEVNATGEHGETPMNMAGMGGDQMRALLESYGGQRGSVDYDLQL